MNIACSKLTKNQRHRFAASKHKLNIQELQSKVSELGQALSTAWQAAAAPALNAHAAVVIPATGGHATPVQDEHFGQ
eukprot:10040988-Karenia_brevis.AAC.1